MQDERSDVPADCRGHFRCRRWQRCSATCRCCTAGRWRYHGRSQRRGRWQRCSATRRWRYPADAPARHHSCGCSATCRCCTTGLCCTSSLFRHLSMLQHRSLLHLSLFRHQPMTLTRCLAPFLRTFSYVSMFRMIQIPSRFSARRIPKQIHLSSARPSLMHITLCAKHQWGSSTWRAAIVAPRPRS